MVKIIEQDDLQNVEFIKIFLPSLEECYYKVTYEFENKQLFASKKYKSHKFCLTKDENGIRISSKKI